VREKGLSPSWRKRKAAAKYLLSKKALYTTRGKEEKGPELAGGEKGGVRGGGRKECPREKRCL